MQPANLTYHLIRGTILLVIISAFGVWLLIRTLRRSEDAVALIVKWIVTVMALGVYVWQADPFGGSPLGFNHIITALICGITLTVVWRRSIAMIVAKPLGDLYDGGDIEVESRPFYSIAVAKRKKGDYTAAVAEIRKQLDKFPNDFDGQLMLAEIQAEDLNDLTGAETTIQRLCNQPGHSPQNIASALYSLADWHLKFAQDREAARQDFQKIIDLYPDTGLALAAAQRIAHVAKTEHLLAPHDRRRVHVPEGIGNIGLLPSSAHLRPSETDPAKAAAEYVAHLVEHPLDTEARENLAVIYADHYGRLDLAGDQLEQLIEQPDRPPKQVAHWLNLLADLQIRHDADHATVRQTLERIIERLPNHSAAELARNRIELLKLESKAKEKSQAVKLGSYEQNVGLKRGSPRQF